MTSPLSQEAVAQMVADREAGTPGPWMIGDAYGSIVSDANTGYDRPDDVDAYGGHLVCESVKWDANACRIARLPDLEAAYLTIAARMIALAAENATLRAEQARDAALVEAAEMLAESRAYALALQEELRVRTAKLERECRPTQAQVDRMLVNSTQMHTGLSGCKIALEQAWASNRERAAKITALTEALTELRAMVVAECPSLLNEDSGGNGELSCQINDLLTGEMTMKTAVGKAADVLLEHLVYYDLVERRGAEIANAVIAELVEIGAKPAPAVTVDIDALAYRFWSIHPKDIPDPVGMPDGYKGGARAWMYATEIREAIRAIAGGGDE